MSYESFIIYLFGRVDTEAPKKEMLPSFFFNFSFAFLTLRM